MKVLVLGAGAWGTALAQVLADNHVEVGIWDIKKETLDALGSTHTNPTYFNDLVFNEAIIPVYDLNQVNNVELVLLAVPTGAIRPVMEQVMAVLNHKVTFINVAKGFDPISHDRLSVLIEKLGGQYCQNVVSLVGPSLAIEVAKRLLTSVAAVCEDVQEAIKVQHLFSNDYFRVYTSTDVVGSEAGVAIKNILAIASGICSGLGQGDNARAALMTRGLVEMRRYGVALGGNPDTYFGLTGIGDLIVTCTSSNSRNYSAGYQIGKANSAEEFLQTNTKTVEGAKAVKVVHEEAKQKGISMPICDQVYAVLYEGVKPSDAINALMSRSLKSEI